MSEKVEFWRAEASRYSALAATSRGVESEGYRIMSRDAESFAEAFAALDALAAARAEVERLTMQYDNMKAYADMRDADLAAVRKENDTWRAIARDAAAVPEYLGEMNRSATKAIVLAMRAALHRALAAQEGANG